MEALVERGDQVTVLTRDPARAKKSLRPQVHAARWNPTERGGWYGELAGQQAVVHLAGEQAVGVRYTEQTKRRIRDSRIESTRRLVEAMSEVEPSRPETFLCVTGVDYYAPGSEPVDESGPPGHDFLAELSRDYEAVALEAEREGVRVVRARLGIVMGEDGGALEQMTKPFKLFAGGPIGTGDQVVSWVHVSDVVGMFVMCIDDTRLAGAVNVTAPNPVTNAELAKAIGKVLGRPSWLKAPGFALKAVFGEGAKPLLTGRAVVPAAMQRAGYQWRYPDLMPALEQTLR